MTGVRVSRRLIRTVMAVCGACVWAAPALAQAQATEALAQARQFYNQQQYDRAIQAAQAARGAPTLADAAGVVLARAHLERYRTSSDPSDLADARTLLVSVNDASLLPRDHIELIVGFGESFYFDGRYGAAAEFFDTALTHADLLGPGGHDRLLEWWAGALDRQAELGPESARRPLYARILARAQTELRQNDRSSVAVYWVAAAACGAGDVDLAWGAALAGWVRATETGAAAVKLRTDLDHLVTEVIIPERAHDLAPTGDARAAAALLQQEWDDVKAQYGAGPGPQASGPTP